MPALHYTPRPQQQQHVTDWQGSGLTRTQYADLHNLSRSSFNRWLARCPPTEHQETPAVPFIPVSISSLPSNIATVTINPSRCSITCQPGQLPAILKELTWAEPPHRLNRPGFVGEFLVRELRLP